MDPAVLSGLRALAAAVILLAYLGIAKRDELKVPASALPFLVVFGVLGFAMVHFAYFKAISHTNVATAILLEYLAPVIVLIVSVLFSGASSLGAPCGRDAVRDGVRALRRGHRGRWTRGISRRHRLGSCCGGVLRRVLAHGRLGLVAVLSPWTLLVYGLVVRSRCSGSCSWGHGPSLRRWRIRPCSWPCSPWPS